MSSLARLYTPDVLGLATALARYPLDDGLRFRGQSRSQTCGSSIDLGLDLDSEGRICRVGLRAHACAIGQAAAAIFCQAAIGRTRTELGQACGAIEAWLAGKSDLPAWPGLAAIAAARDFPARHGAITLAWKAGIEALPTS
ncbi:MAG TPA: iron-sulfur cluster assembly scaffold protein [Novosphingobium sp.]|nr:iron-sulfur cluster assembly scaffold protein [Novosphingobium sp.]